MRRVSLFDRKWLRLSHTPVGWAPPVGRSLPSWWVVPGLAMLLATTAVYVLLIQVNPDWSWRLVDTAVYQGGGAAVATGAPLYGQEFGHVPWPFTYPPFAAVVFSPLSALSLDAAGAVLAVLALVSVAATGWLVLGARGHPPGAGRLGVTAVLTAVVMWLEPFHSEVSFGQINAVLMLLVVSDLLLPDWFRGKGVLLGLAVGVKLVPAILVLYLLLTGRWRAATVATGTFAATVVLGFLAAPASSWRYWSGVFADAGRVAGEAGPGSAWNQSINGLAVRLLGDGGPATAIWLVLAMAAAAGGLALARAAYRRGDDLVGIFITGLTGLLVSPISWSHNWVWVSVGLALAVDAGSRLTGRAQVIAAAVPTAAVLAMLAWPVTSGQGTGGLELVPGGVLSRGIAMQGNGAAAAPVQLLQENLYLLVGAGLAVAATVWLRRFADPGVRERGGDRWLLMAR